MGVGKACYMHELIEMKSHYECYIATDTIIIREQVTLGFS